MQLTAEQKGWWVSVVCHVAILSVLSVSWHRAVQEPPKKPSTVQLVVVEKPQPKKVVNTKRLVRKVAKKKVVAKKPTALPGDRKHAVVKGQVVPVYPKAAQNYGWEGTVAVKVRVSATGAIASIKVVQSSGHKSLDGAYIRALKQARFKPKKVMGKTVSDALVMRHTFAMGGAM